MHIKFNSAKNLAFYLSHPCSMTQSVRGKEAIKHSDKLLIGANERGVALIGSRGSQSYERIVPVSEFELIKAGAIAVESVKLLGVIRTFNDQPVSLEVISNNSEDSSLKMVVKSGRSRININEVVDANEVARTSIALEDSTSFEFNLSLLKEMLQAVKPALSEDAAQANMRCLQLKLTDNVLSCSTVDGRRIGIAKAMLDKSYPNELIALLPPKVVDLIIALTAETDHCQIQISKVAIAIIVGSLKFQSSLIDVKFPDVNLVLPKDAVAHSIIRVKPFIEVLERSKIAVDVSSNKSTNVPPRINLSFSKDGVIHCESIKNNSVITEEEFLVENIQLASGNVVDTAFDYNFLQQAISACKSQTVSFTLAFNEHAEKDDPPMILISPLDQNKRFQLLSLLMPQRL